MTDQLTQYSNRGGAKQFFDHVFGPIGYRAREDVTTLDKRYLIPGTRNVVTTVKNTWASVKGYSVDGTGSTTPDSGIRGNFDFDTYNGRKNVRCGFLTTSDGKMQFRSTISGSPIWLDLITSLTSVDFAFVSFYDTTELKNLLLGVNGDGYIYEWSGGEAVFASATTNTITCSGTDTWQQNGFYTTRNKELIINGVTYTYTGGEGTQTLTGVTPDPTSVTITVGDSCYQKPIKTAISAMSDILTTFTPDVIGRNTKNQIYLGAWNSNAVYVSNVNNYKDFGFTSPTRVVGEGMIYYLDAEPRAFIPQETSALTSSSMLISAGRDYWYRETSTLSSDLASEQLELKPLRTGRLQGALSFKCTSRVKNGVAYLGNDNVVNILGQESSQFIPELADISYSIINDMNSYDLTDAAMFYHKNFIYLTVPKHGLIRMYNMTNPKLEYWEGPVEYPISDFFVTDDGKLGGHAYSSSESYILFDTNRFRYDESDNSGYAITAIAQFVPNTHGNRTQTSNTQNFWIDGYISGNVSSSSPLVLTLTHDLDGCQTTQSKSVVGDGKRYNCPIQSTGTIGDSPIGGSPIGSGTDSSRPAYFHVILDFPTISSYLEMPTFSTEDVDYQWEIISFGSYYVISKEGNNAIHI